MKRLFFTVLPLIALIGCSKDEANNNQNIPKPGQSARSISLANPIAQDVNKAMAEFQLIIDANRSRLKKGVRSKKDCKSTIQVPRDFTTIQEAVDNACDGAVIIVKAGTYTELVVVEKPGIKFKSNGNVTLIGGFVLNKGANDVDIQQFNIVIGENNTHGINAREVSGGRIFLNTITDPAHKGGTAIQYFNGSRVFVHKNSIHGTGSGIFFGSLIQNGDSHDNTISNNHITGLTKGSGVGLQGNCDNNVISENIIVDNLSVSNAGILFFSGNAWGGDCDNNTARNNISNNGYVGAFIFNGGTNNRIGPNNTLNANKFNGFVISGSAAGNTIFNNTMQGNGGCDIINGASVPLSNTFKNNSATCTQGL